MRKRTQLRDRRLPDYTRGEEIMNMVTHIVGGGLGVIVLLLSGGIAYTVGAVLYGIGVKKRWMHSIFHIFVVLGSVLQFLAIYVYAL